MDTNKRNRLLHKQLNDIVFVSYNRKMKTRKIFDPLVIEEFDWDNEWADSSYVHPQGAVGVTMVTMVMALHGNIWMKLLVHQARCEAAIFQGMPAASVQEMDSQGWLNLKKT